MVCFRIAPVAVLLLLLCSLGGTRADCWSIQHPDDPRPDLPLPIPTGWRRPAWAHVS
eukprot:COSAG05_NODE_12973_length_446_cov_1.164265_1_plen_56_part_10